MELLQLQYFLEVANSQHVTRSARTLRVSQPSLTQAIHRLERELGVKLFEPSGRGIRLTEAGKLYQQRISHVLSDLDAATKELEQFKDDRSETVRIDVVSASSIVVDAVAAWQANHPHARFQIVNSETGGSKPQPCDIEVRMLPAKTTHTKGGALFKERIMLAVPTDDAAALGEGSNGQSYGAGLGADVAQGNCGGNGLNADGTANATSGIEAGAASGAGAVSLDQVKDCGFIMLAGSRNVSDLCLGQCAKLGFRPTIAFESDNPSVVRKMIGLGLGVGFWPEHSWGELGSGARLLPIREPGFARTIQVARIEHGNAHPEAAAFYDFLVEQFKKRWAE